MFVPVLQLRAQNTAWLLGTVNYSWSLRIVLESPVCQKQDSWKKKANKQKPSLRRVDSDIRGSSSVLPQNRTCIFTDNWKNVTKVLRNSTDPSCSHSMSKFCSCCHGNGPPTQEVDNINCIIWSSINFEGNELLLVILHLIRSHAPEQRPEWAQVMTFSLRTLFYRRSGPPTHQTHESSQTTRPDSLSLTTAIPSDGGSWQLQLASPHQTRDIIFTGWRCQGNQWLKPLLSLDLQTAQR